MSFILAAWPIIKRLLPFIAGALVIIGALLWLRSWGNGREAEGVAKERATWQPVVAAIKVRNAEIERLRQVSATAVAATDTALERAQEARQAQSALSARLKVASRAKGGSCPVAAVNREAWEVAQ